jgi:hypothetical protein
LPLTLPLADNLVSDGGGGVLDFVWPLASEGMLATMSDNTKNRGVSFMAVVDPSIVNETNK